MTLDNFLNETRTRLESALQESVADSASPVLQQAVHYSLLGGGKRLRPALACAASQLVNAPDNVWLVPAQALEMIHVYSLIHDDLPAMDDDSLRRGKPTCHQQYDEATAILAGDALQSEAFRVIADSTELSDRQVRLMIQTLARCAGSAGMVGGQMIDLESEHQTLSLAQLSHLHRLKTGALIKASLQLGVMCQPDADPKIAGALADYAEALGLAFQITDDVLDVIGSTDVLGKTSGSDLQAEKSTYVQLLGIDGARAQARKQIDRATDALRQVDQDENSVLWQLASYVIERDH